MRLLSLRENKTISKQAIEMFCAYTIEQESEKGVKKTKEKVFPECEQMLQEKLLDSNRQIFLFENNHAIIGFAEVVVVEECFPDEDLPETCMKVFAFYIAPEFRRKHFGSHYFKLIRDWGREQKASLLEMEVPVYPVQANEFLKQQGLELVGTGAQNCYRAFL